jgi:hypothetical protein
MESGIFSTIPPCPIPDMGEFKSTPVVLPVESVTYRTAGGEEVAILTLCSFGAYIPAPKHTQEIADKKTAPKK